MGWDAPWHWVVLAIIVIALFGYKKLPDASRALGRSLRIFKTEIKGMSQDDSERDAARTEQAALPPAVPPANGATAAPTTPTQPAVTPPVQHGSTTNTSGTAQ
jgi:sec-independent protein translocase protein TatA